MASREVHYLLIAVCFIFFLCGGIYYYNSDKTRNLIKSGKPKSEKNFTLQNGKAKWGRETNSNIGTKQDGSSTTQHIGQQQGYVVPFRLYEQQTMAARNLWHLQYWANTVNMKVVEPFVSNATFNFLPVVDGVSNPMRFGDLYDKDFWNNQATNNSCAGLVTWEEFLLNAPKTTILVLPKGSSTESITIETNPDKIGGKELCQGKFPPEASAFFKMLGFKFVRGLCILFSPSAKMSIQQFSEYILDKYTSSSVTVIFGLWQGIAKSRVNIEASKMGLQDTVHVALIPSVKMMKSSEEYLKKLPNGDGSKYYGVMVRLERVCKGSEKKGYTTDEAVNYMKDCATSLTELFKPHPEWGRSLAIDVGQYGSLGMRRKSKSTQIMDTRQMLYEAFFTALYGSSWTISDFEDSFKTYSDTGNAVVIAQLQRTIAAKSDCIVLIGGGSSFQASALEMYKRFHPNEQEQCIIKHCFKRVNFNIPHAD